MEGETDSRKLSRLHGYSFLFPFISASFLAVTYFIDAQYLALINLNHELRFLLKKVSPSF